MVDLTHSYQSISSCGGKDNSFFGLGLYISESGGADFDHIYCKDCLQERGLLLDSYMTHVAFGCPF